MAKTIYKEISSTLSQLLGDIDLGKLALPDLQRPFVWKKSEVRDLLDSMYRGFPIGYLMLWHAAEVSSKTIGTDGKQHTPSEFIIDGQQRLTSLYAVMKGREVVFKDFSKGRIRIAFRPRDGRFEVSDAAIAKDPEFIPDITDLWVREDWEVANEFIDRLRKANPGALNNGGESSLRNGIGRLNGLIDYPFQGVQIGHEIDEERVADIFLRVNSGGTPLTQADFILTLLSVFREDDRRRLEAFAEASNLVPADPTPSPYNHLIVPSPDQLLRVAILLGFKRGRLQSALALLRGGGVDGGELTETEREAQLDTLTIAIDKSLDLTNWHEYLKTLMAAGFRRSTEISSENNAVLVYALYLVGRHEYDLSHADLRTPIARFFFMSSLTRRYTGSFETQVTQDVQGFTEAKSGAEFLEKIQQMVDSNLTPDFWTTTLPLELATSAARGPGLFAYAAALCLLNARVPPFGTTSDGTPKAAVFLRDLFDPVMKPKKQPLDRHHLFPRKYLERNGVAGTRMINQIANLGYVEWPENIEISDKAPSEYWPSHSNQFSHEDLFHHALPDGWHEMPYETFLSERRKLIAEVIKAGFEAIGATPEQSQSAPDLVTKHQFETYLHPDTPFSNEMAVRRIVRKLEGTVFWYEQHMDRKVLEILHDELAREDVTEVRLLSGPANLSAKARKAFERFSAELANHGIPSEWRVLGADVARTLHARVISDDDEVFELPPLNSILAGTVDSIRESNMPLDAFEEAWEDQATPLAELQLSA